MKFKRLFSFLFLSLFSVFKFIEGVENNKNKNENTYEKVEVLTFNPEKLVQELDEIKAENKYLEELFKKESENLQIEIDGINERKKELNKEIKEKGASMDEDLIKRMSMDIYNAEREIYQKQVSIENSFRQRISDLSLKAKSLIDNTLEEYIKKNENCIVIPVEYAQNKKFDITKDLVKVCNENYKKRKNVDKKSEVKSEKKEKNFKEKFDERVVPVKIKD